MITPFSPFFFIFALFPVFFSLQIGFSNSIIIGTRLFENDMKIIKLAFPSPVGFHIILFLTVLLQESAVVISTPN